MLWLQNSNLLWRKEQKGFASLLKVNSIILIAQAGILKGDEPSAFDLICWMFTTTFLHTHHSLLAKLSRWGWLMRMRLDWKKSQNTLDTSNRIHRNKTRSTGSVGKGLGSQLSHDWELHTRKQAGSWLVWGSLTDHNLSPTNSPFTTCRVRGVYYYPDPPWAPFY